MGQRRDILIYGTLTNSGTITVDATSTLAPDGTIDGGTIDAQTGAGIASATLVGVTIDGSFQVVDENNVTVEDGLTLNGTATLGSAGSGNWGTLDFNGSQTLGGSGTVTFDGPGPYNAVGVYNATLTIGPQITVQGQSGYVGDSPETGGSPGSIAVVNQGTIQADTSGTTITIYGTGNQNTGSLKALNGATLSIQGTLTNSGTITVDGTSTLASGGTIAGGTIDAQTGAGIGSVTLDGVTIDGNFQVTDENSVTVEDGLTVNGTATLGGSGSGNYGYFLFSGSQTLGGSGTVIFNGPGPYNALALASGTLTLALESRSKAHTVTWATARQLAEVRATSRWSTREPSRGPTAQTS